MIGGDKVSSAQSHLSEKCSLLCSLADSRLTTVMEQVFDASIPLKEMEFVLKNQLQVEKLCVANEMYKLDRVQMILNRRDYECTAFRSCKTRLDSLSSKLVLSKLQITGKAVDSRVEFRT